MAQPSIIYSEIGAMRHEVGIYQAVTARNDVGRLEETFPGVADATVWAAIEQTSAEEAPVGTGGKTEGRVKRRLRIWYYAGLSIRDRLKLVETGDWYRITAIERVREVNEWHLVDAVEITGL